MIQLYLLYILFYNPLLFTTTYNYNYYVIKFASIYSNYPELNFYIKYFFFFIFIYLPKKLAFYKYRTSILIIFLTFSSLSNFFFNNSVFELFISTNYLLINPINFIHPLFLQSLIAILYILIIITILLSIIQLELKIYIYLIKILLFKNLFYSINLITIFLGILWAQQISTWGGWWNWDPSEYLIIILTVILITLNHLSYNKHFLILILNILFIYTLSYITLFYWNQNLISWNFHIFFSNNITNVSLLPTTLIFKVSLLIYYLVYFFNKKSFFLSKPSLLKKITVDLIYIYIYKIIILITVVVLYSTQVFCYWKYILIFFIFFNYLLFWNIHNLLIQFQNNSIRISNYLNIHLLLLLFVFILAISDLFLTINIITIQFILPSPPILNWKFNILQSINIINIAQDFNLSNLYITSNLYFGISKWLEYIIQSLNFNVLNIISENSIHLFILLLYIFV